MEFIRPTYPVEVFTATHKITGNHQPIGAFMTALNDPERTCFALEDATFTPLVPSAALRTVSVPLAVVNADDILFICFQDDTLRNELTLLRRAQRVIAYTPIFAVRGEFHLGAEDQVRDMLDSMRGDFQALTDVTLFPLKKIQVGVQREHALIVINKRAIQLYHPEIAN